MSAEWTLGFYREPFLATLRVEIVLWITGEDYNLIISGKSNQADGAVWHLGIFSSVAIV